MHEECILLWTWQLCSATRAFAAHVHTWLQQVHTILLYYVLGSCIVHVPIKRTQPRLAYTRSASYANCGWLQRTSPMPRCGKAACALCACATCWIAYYSVVPPINCVIANKILSHLQGSFMFVSSRQENMMLNSPQFNRPFCSQLGIMLTSN